MHEAPNNLTGDRDAVQVSEAYISAAAIDARCLEGTLQGHALANVECEVRWRRDCLGV
jgi:hypothetical protein